MPRLSASLIIILALCTLVAANERDWKTGKVVDTENSERPAVFAVAIEGEEYVYVATNKRKWRWTDRPHLTVNASIKYAVEKNDLYLIDDEGREFKLKIQKKILKEKSP